MSINKKKSSEDKNSTGEGRSTIISQDNTMNGLLLVSLNVFSRLGLGLFSYYENQNKTISQRVTISCDGPLNILRQAFVSWIDVNLCLLRPQPPESQKHRCVVLLYLALWKAQGSLECFLETGSCSITQAVWELTMEFRLSQANKCCSYSHELPYLSSSTVLSWKYFLCAWVLGLRPSECRGQWTTLRELALLSLQCGFQGWNSEPRGQVVLPPEPSCWLCNVLLH